MRSDVMSSESIKMKIAEKREEMHVLARQQGITAAVVEKSQQLDDLLNMYNRMYYQSKN